MYKRNRKCLKGVQENKKRQRNTRLQPNAAHKAPHFKRAVAVGRLQALIRLFAFLLLIYYADWWKKQTRSLSWKSSNLLVFVEPGQPTASIWISLFPS